eukprot:1750015-Rhodomonas_salina.2
MPDHCSRPPDRIPLDHKNTDTQKLGEPGTQEDGVSDSVTLSLTHTHTTQTHSHTQQRYTDRRGTWDAEDVVPDSVDEALAGLLSLIHI